jgi:hypothetical protein
VAPVAPVAPVSPVAPVTPVLPRINENFSAVGKISGSPGITLTSVAIKSYVSVPGTPSVLNFHPPTFPVVLNSGPMILYGPADPLSK